jgi:hypothetical protein
VLPTLRGHYSQVRVQPRRRGDGDDVRVRLRQHFLVRREVRHAPQRAGIGRALRIGVAHRHELETIDLIDRLEMVFADAPRAGEGDSEILLWAQFRIP